MEAITLAHQSVIRLADLEVRPATRMLVRGDREKLVEPRVMKVLVALLQAEGGVVARDDLIDSCWEGRIVGDDAVNRIMSRLRRLSEDIGAGVFSVETINRVGYRLRSHEKVDLAAVPPINLKLDRGELRPAISRRAWLIGGAATLAASASGVILLSQRGSAVPTDVQVMMDDARAQARQNTREGQNQGIALYQQVVTRVPAYAPAWAALSLTYALTSRYRDSQESGSLLARAKDSAARAVALAPDDPLSEVAAACARRLTGHWTAMEPAIRQGAAERPRDEWIMSCLSWLLQAVGYNAEALTIDDGLAAFVPPTPSLYYSRIRSAWYSGQLVRTDQLLEEAARLYPTHFGIWLSRFYIYLASGRPDASIAMTANRTTHPTNIPAEEVEAVTRVAEAVRSPTTALVDDIQAEWLARAHQGAGYAENAAQFLALLGRPQVAMQILNAYYFGENFAVPELRFTTEQGTYTPVSERLTPWIGSPMLACLHGSIEFARLCERLGLATYWRERSRPPDWLRKR